MLHYISFMHPLIDFKLQFGKSWFPSLSSQHLKHFKVHNYPPCGHNSLYQVYIMSGSLIHLFYLLFTLCDLGGVCLRKDMLVKLPNSKGKTNTHLPSSTPLTNPIER